MDRAGRMEIVPVPVTYKGLDVHAAVQFKAGRMILVEGKLSPDTRKGLIRIIQDTEQLMHFLWYERQGAGFDTIVEEPEIDIIVFPDESKFSKLPVGSGRIYKLEVQADKAHTHHFWMQNGKDKWDEELAEATQEVLNGLGFGLLDDMDEDMMMATAGEGETDEEETAAALMSLSRTNAAPAASRAPAHPFATYGSTSGQGYPIPQVSTSNPGPITASALAAALRTILPPPAPAGTQMINAAQLASMLAGLGGNLPQQQQMQQMEQQQRQMMRAPGPTLAEVLKPEVLLPLMRDPDVLARLAEHLPEEHRNPAALAELAGSAQLRHQMDVFSSALMTAQLDLSHFGLRSRGFTTADLLEAIQEKADSEAAERSAGESK